MEETKQVCGGEGCHHSCMDMHKFCPRSCCIIRCIFTAVVLLVVFAAGGAAAVHERYERDWRHGGYSHYGCPMMMQYTQDQGYWNVAL